MLSSLLILDVVHADFPGKRWAELRFLSDMTVEQVKEKLYRHTGTSPSNMKLYAYQENDNTKAIALVKDSDTLSSYEITSGMALFIEDIKSEAKNYVMGEPNESVPLVKLSDEEYEQRHNTARKFLQQLRKNCKNLQNTKIEEKQEMTETKIAYNINDRCEVLCLGGVRGKIIFIGKRPLLKGEWVGIYLDEPLGNDDVPECPSGYGCFIQTEYIKSKLLIGDYPPLDLLNMNESCLVNNE